LQSILNPTIHYRNLSFQTQELALSLGCVFYAASQQCKQLILFVLN
jgi:hypothetical protein